MRFRLVDARIEAELIVAFHAQANEYRLYYICYHFMYL